MKDKTEVQSSKAPDTPQKRPAKRKNKTEVRSSKPTDIPKIRAPKRKRNDETECSNMGWTTPELTQRIPSENGKPTNSDYKPEQNTVQAKKAKY